MERPGEIAVVETVQPLTAGKERETAREKRVKASSRRLQKVTNH